MPAQDERRVHFRGLCKRHTLVRSAKALPGPRSAPLAWCNFDVSYWAREDKKQSRAAAAAAQRRENERFNIHGRLTLGIPYFNF